MFGILFFIFITIFLILKLKDILGMDIGFKVDVQSSRVFSEEDSVEEVTHPADDLENKISQVSRFYPGFRSDDFMDKAKKAFEIIFLAYAKGDEKTLKNLMATRIYNAFSLAIVDRKSRKEILEGSLIRFVNAYIVDANISDDEILVTMKFDTEQSNVLKSEDGEVLEGNPDFIENRSDIWVFCRKKDSTDSRWFLCGIKDKE